MRASLGTAMVLPVASLAIRVDITRLGIQLPIVWCREHCGVADGGPDQPPGPSEKPPMGFHAADAFVVDPQPQPAVPWEVFELHGPDEDRRVETGLRVTGDILLAPLNNPSC